MQHLESELKGLPHLRFEREYFLAGSHSWNQLTKQILFNDLSQPSINQSWSITTKPRRKKKRLPSFRIEKDTPYNMRIRRQSCHCLQCGEMSNKQKSLMRRGVVKDIKQHTWLQLQRQSSYRDPMKNKAKTALLKHAKTIIAVAWWKTKNIQLKRVPCRRNTIESSINHCPSKTLITRDSNEKNQIVKSYSITMAKLLRIRKPSKDVQKYLDSKSTTVSQYQKPNIPKLKLAPLQEKYHPYLHRKSISNKFF